MGIVLNRRSEVAVGDAVPPLAALVGPNELVYLGGPVQPEAVVVLADFAEPGRAGQLVLGSVGFLPGELDEAAALGDLHAVRVFAGYAGWGRGQLEAELEEGSWLVFPALSSDVFTERPARPVARRAPSRRRKVRTSRLAPGRSTRQLTHVALET